MSNSAYACVVACACLGAGTAHAEADWFASLYTGDGVELRADEHVFALYALLNAMGYDRAPVARENPLPKYAFSPVRQQLRLKLGALDPAVRKAADAYFDAHPQPLQRYLAYTVALPKESAELKGFDAVLKSATTSWNLPDLLGQVQAEYRKALRGYLPALDVPLGRARKLLRVADNGPSTVLIMNLLDGQDEAYGVKGDGQIVVVVGPSDKPNVEGVLREYARVVLEPAVAKKAQSAWSGGAALLKEARADGATEATPGEYATALFARAAALDALQAPDAAYEAEAQKGYFGLKELAKGLDEGKPVEGWAMEALARAETRRPAKR